MKKLQIGRKRAAITDTHARTVVLAQSCDMAASIELYTAFVTSDDDEDIMLDGREVAGCSTSFAQVLLAAARAQQARNRTFTISNASSALTEVFEDLGLSDRLVWETTSNG
jgi:anti-anti-sigma regulatory factor